MRKILKSIFLITLLSAFGLSQPDWTVNPADFEFSGSVTAAVQVDDAVVGSGEDMLAAFVEGELRGVVNGLFYPTGEYYVFFLVINSNTVTGETVNFQYYHSQSDAVYDLEETLDFTSDMIIGNAVAPFEFNLYTDCYGTISGSAVIDDCGQCCSGESGVECSYYNGPDDFGGLYDCNGVCNGEAIIDECGVCCAGSTGTECSFFNSIEDFGGAYDCTGTCFGTSEIDSYGNCCEASEIDCGGLCYGQAVLDDFFDCCVDPDLVYYDGDDDGLGDPDSTAYSCGYIPMWVLNGNDMYPDCAANFYDCAGVCGGDALELEYWIDYDGDGWGSEYVGVECSINAQPNWVLQGGDEYDDIYCESNYFDCTTTCDGTAYLDDCGICSGGNSGHPANSDQDCAGVCFGTAVELTYWQDIDGDGLGGEYVGVVCDADADPTWVTNDDDLYDDIYCESNIFDCDLVCDGDAYIADFYFDNDADGLGGALAAGNICSADAEAGWVTNSDDLYDDIYCLSNIFDCALVCDGEAVIDDCGDCTGGTTGIPFNDALDCAGVCDGDAFVADFYYDNDEDGLGGAMAAAGICSVDAEAGWVTNSDDLYDDIFCLSNSFDCALVCDGEAYLDDCGVCSGGTTGHIANSDMDCADVCFGPAVEQTYWEDEDGDGLGGEYVGVVCDAFADPTWVMNNDDLYDDIYCLSNTFDCALVCDGDAFISDFYFDNDTDGLGGALAAEEICSADADAGWVTNTGDLHDDIYCLSNTFDCALVCDGDAFISDFYFDNDEDGLGGALAAGNICSADAEAGWVTNTGDLYDDIYCLSNIFDCALVCDGEAVIDDCGDCTGGTTGIPFNDALDCAGVCDGDAFVADFYYDNDEDGLGGALAAEGICSVDAEAGWVTNSDDLYDDIFCLSNSFDCALVCDGEAYLDDCDVCSGGTTGHIANSDMDCADVCFGPAVEQTYWEDEDGDGLGGEYVGVVCDAFADPTWVMNNDDLYDDIYCLSNTFDCALVCDGDAFIADFYYDNDADGLGGALAAEEICSADADAGWVTNTGDLHDDIYCLSNTFDCALVCDGEAFISDFYFDNDADGLGGALAAEEICSADADAGWVTNTGDLHDDIYCLSNTFDCALVCDGDAFISDFYFDNDADGLGGALAAGNICSADADAGWVTNTGDLYDDIYCLSNIFDCALVCDGEAVIDDCGDCTGGTTGIPFNDALDCAGVCDGDAFVADFYYDNDEDSLGGALAAEGICSVDAEAGWVTNSDDLYDDIFCLSNSFDCALVCDGEAYLDDCDVCSGGTTGHPANSDKDCAGVCFGDAEIVTYWLDEDGDGWGSELIGDVCDAFAEPNYVTNSDDTDDSIYCLSNYIDCLGICDGDAVIDECGVCDGPGAYTWYQDQDEDGWGNPEEMLDACTQPDGYVANGDDLNDNLYCLSNLLDDCGVLCGDGSSCHAPIAFNSYVETDENTALEFVFSANDPDGDIGSLTAVPTNGPGYGILEVDGLNAVYTPSPGYSGMDYVFFYVTDGEYDSQERVVTITILAGSNAPMAEEIYLDLNEDQEIFVTLIGTSDDSDDEALEFEIVNPPLHGDIAEDRALGYYIYTPHQDYFGPDSGSYRIYDNDLELYSDIAWVHLDILPVNDPPVIMDVSAPDGVFEVEENGVLPVTVILDDIEGDDLTLIFSEQFPLNGMVDDPIVTDYTVTFNYYPDMDYFGSDNIILWAAEQDTQIPLNSQQFNINVTVIPVVEPPLAFDQTVNVMEDGSVDVFLSGSGAGRIEFALADPPLNGTAELTGSVVTYTPHPDYDEIDTFTFVTLLSGVESEPATVTVNVLPMNDPPEVTDFTVDTDISTQFDIAPHVTDVDNEFNELWPHFLPVNQTTFMGGSIVYVDDFVYEYIPPAVPVGEDYIMYKVVDRADESAYALITFITPGGVMANFRDAPVISLPDTQQMSEDGTLTVTILALDTSGNMFDENATYDVFTEPMHGTLTYVSGPDSPSGMSVIFELTYQPEENYNGADSFEITVTNPNNSEPTSDPATYNILISAVNDIPFIDPITDQEMDEDTSEMIMFNAGDPDDTPVDLTVSSSQPQVMVSIVDDQLTVDLQNNWFGDALITVTATESIGDGLTAQTSFNLTVNPVNDAPAMVPFQDQITLEEMELIIPLHATDVDGNTDFTFDAFTPDLDPVIVLVNVVDETLVVTPQENMVGVVDVSVWAYDDEMEPSDTFDFTVTIVDSNDPPELDPDEIFTQTVSEDGANIIYTITPTDVDIDDMLNLEVVASNSSLFPPMNITIVEEDALSGVSRTVTLDPADNKFGKSTIIFNVTDHEGENFALQDSVLVLGVNDAPLIISNPAPTVLVDEEFTYSVIAADPDPDDQDMLSYSISNFPAGMEITVDGIITWTPDASFDTSGPVTVRVEDPSMEYDEQTFTVEVLHFDCAGVPGGTAYIDACGICSGGDTGFIPNTCTGDMNGSECSAGWFGPDFDDCGVCFGPGESIWFADIDNDGLGDINSSYQGCEQPPGFVTDSSDSDDSIYCLSNVIDECGVCDGPGILTWYMDADMDGLGDAGMSMDACEQPDGYVSDNTDSDDSIYCLSNVIDVCGVCDGPGILTWYMDADMDGLGDAGMSMDACEQPDGYVSDNTDSDDSIYCLSNVIDVCGVCDGPGPLDWYYDFDDDGLGDPDVMVTACTAPDDYVSDNTDIDDSINCPTNIIDCAGVCDGEAYLDDCDVCSGGTTGHVGNSDIDCAGVCFGDAIVMTYWVDNDGDGLGGAEAGQFCSGTVDPALVTVPGDVNDDLYCVSNMIDCNNDCDGTAAVDNCGICAGGSTGLVPNADDLGCGCFEPAPVMYYPDVDEDGDGFGDAAGFCEDPGLGWSLNNLDPEPNCITNNTDCAGECGGSAVEDDCGYCTGGSTGLIFNFADLGCGCGEPAPMPYYPDIDEDGDGAGDVATEWCDDPGTGWSLTNTDPEPECATNDTDCAGVCGGSAELDCAGVCNGDAYIDICGICAGGTTGETPCTFSGNIWSGNLDEIIIGDVDHDVFMTYPPLNEIYSDGDYIIRDEAAVDVFTGYMAALEGYSLDNAAYSFTPQNFFFRDAVSVTIPYDLPLGRLPSDGAVMVWLDNEMDTTWSVIEMQNCGNGVCTGDVHSMGIFTVAFRDGTDLQACLDEGITFGMDPDAYVDNCGSCISTLIPGSAACVQDDTGQWGGAVFCDACGVCDDDPTNDNACVVEASDFHVYPNPLTEGDAVYFSYYLDRDCSGGTGVIQIYDFAGDEVDKITLDAGLLTYGQHEVQWLFDTDLQRGGYVAVFVFNDGTESGNAYTKIGIR